MLLATKHLCFFVTTAGEKSELGIIITSLVKVHTSYFPNRNHIWNKTYPTFSWPASNFLQYFYSHLSPFLIRYVLSPKIYFCKFIWICFSLFRMEFFILNLNIHFKKCQNFQTKKKLKKLTFANTFCIPQISHII